MFSPAAFSRHDTYETSWQYLEASVKPWASYAARELKATDYIQSVIGATELFNLPLTEDDGTPFDESEKKILRERLVQIERHVCDAHPSSEEFQSEVRAHFQFLNVQLERSERRAFFYCVFGTVATIGTAYLGRDGTREALNFAAEQMGNVTRLLVEAIR